MALETTAALAGDAQPKPVPTENRFDQDPVHFSVVSWDLSQAFRGPQDFKGPALKGEMERKNSNTSEASTGAGSLESKASKISDFSSASGWDEEVLKKNTGADMKIGQGSASKPSKAKKGFFQSMFTPPWRSCACDSSA
jgi:hypothetical protein